MVSKKLFSSLLFSSLLFSANSYALDFNLEKLITDVATGVINNIPDQKNQNPSNTTPEARPEEIKTTGQTEQTNIPSKKIQTADNSSTQASSSSRTIDVESIPSTICFMPAPCQAFVVSLSKTEVCNSFKFELLDREVIRGNDHQLIKFKDGTQRYRYKVKVLDDGKMRDFKTNAPNGKVCTGFEGWFEQDGRGNIPQKTAEYYNAKF